MLTTRNTTLNSEQMAQMIKSNPEYLGEFLANDGEALKQALTANPSLISQALTDSPQLFLDAISPATLASALTPETLTDILASDDGKKMLSTVMETEENGLLTEMMRENPILMSNMSKDEMALKGGLRRGSVMNRIGEAVTTDPTAFMNLISEDPKMADVMAQAFSKNPNFLAGLLSQNPEILVCSYLRIHDPEF
jgi:hypothetical protein